MADAIQRLLRRVVVNVPWKQEDNTFDTGAQYFSGISDFFWFAALRVKAVKAITQNKAITIAKAAKSQKTFPKLILSIYIFQNRSSRKELGGMAAPEQIYSSTFPTQKFNHLGR